MPSRLAVPGVCHRLTRAAARSGANDRSTATASTGWTYAGDPEPTDTLRSTTNDDLHVTSTRSDATWTTVYNLDVATADTYFVGNLTLWVHNANGYGELYEVGTASQLRGNPARGTSVHHAPGSRNADGMVGGYNNANRSGNEVGIRLPNGEHAAVTAAQRAAPASASARGLLAQEIRILRANTSAPNSALREIVRLNNRLHPYDFYPFHR